MLAFDDLFGSDVVVVAADVDADDISVYVVTV